MARQHAVSTLLTFATLALMASIGLVSSEPDEAWASSDPCVAAATLSDAIGRGVPGASGASGSVNNPWIVSTAGELAKVSELANQLAPTYRTGHFRQTAHIDLGGCLFTPIGLKTGSDWTSDVGGIVQVDNFHYDGGGHFIRGLKIDRIGYGGLFTRFNSGSVKNLGLVNVNIKATTFVGGFVGELRNCNSTIFSNIFVTGTVEGSQNVGAIAGVLGDGCSANTTQLLNSYANVRVTGGNNPTGGLGGRAGHADRSVIRNSYSSGQIAQSGLESVTSLRYGGLFGGNSPAIVPNIQNSFWDTETSNLATSNGGEGKTSLQMKQFSTFHDAGWDIVNGWDVFSTTGTPKIWGICTGVNSGYPFLLWEYSSNPCLSAPTAPSITSIAPASSSGTLSVAFTAPTSDGGAVVSNYKYSTDNGATWVTRSPNATTSPLVIQGLTNGTSYQVKLLAINSVGDGAASNAVSGTPLTSASAPAITAIIASSGALSVAFTAPSSNGGATISNYKYSLDNGVTWVTRSAASTTSPLVVTGLTNGTSYQVRLLAVNSEGDGAASTAVTGTPVAPAPSTSPTPAATAATPASLTVGPTPVLASTGSNLLSNWGIAGLTILIGLALVLLSSFRRRELQHHKS